MSVTDRDHLSVAPDAADAAGSSVKPAGRLAAARTGARIRRSEAERARENAMGLLPEVPAPRPRRRRHRLVALVSAIAALAIIVTIFGGAWELARFNREVGPQETTAASLSNAQEATYRGAAEKAAAAPPGTGDAPVVLAYHDIAIKSDSEYVVTPRAFADQMAMLREAGYTTLTQEELTAYSAGDFTPPPRSAVITFDDGTSGLWTYGDKILEDNGFHAISFVITGWVGLHAPYYLTWNQIERMEKTGRWSFGSHTGTLHTRVPIGEDGADVGSVLTHREYDRGRLESYRQFTDRVSSDLERSVADFAEHDLPRPTLFAWPFSEVTASDAVETDTRPLAYTRAQVDRLFDVSFVNNLGAPRPAVPEDLEAGLVERHEIFRPDDADDLFEAIGRMEQLPVAEMVPNEVSQTWLEPTSQPAPMVLSGASSSFDAATETYIKANWAPQRTSTWETYSVEARINGLGAKASTPPGQAAPASNSAGLRARVGREGEITARASSTWMNVSRGDQSVYSGPLPLPGSAATLRLDVTPDAVVVTVDGQTIATVPAEPGDGERVASGSSMPGSFGVVSQRGDDPAAPFPSVEDLTVRPLG